MRAPSKAVQLFVASSNAHKLSEYRALSAGQLEVLPVPNFDRLPVFEETAPTFSENAIGKALYYGHLTQGFLIADDSGLVVPALGGAPGVQSARYAGPNASSADRITKLLVAMRDVAPDHRRARFVCVIALVENGDVRGVFSASVEGEITEAPRGQAGFGYDPVFFYPPLRKTFAELSGEEKNRHSHRGIAARKAMDYLTSAFPGRRR